MVVRVRRVQLQLFQVCVQVLEEQETIWHSKAKGQSQMLRSGRSLAFLEPIFVGGPQQGVELSRVGVESRPLFAHRRFSMLSALWALISIKVACCCSDADDEGNRVSVCLEL